MFSFKLMWAMTGRSIGAYPTKRFYLPNQVIFPICAPTNPSLSARAMCSQNRLHNFDFSWLRNISKPQIQRCVSLKIDTFY